MDRGDVTPEQWRQLVADNTACMNGIGDLKREADQLRAVLEGDPRRPYEPGLLARVHNIETHQSKMERMLEKLGENVLALGADVSALKTFMGKYEGFEQQAKGGKKVIWFIGAVATLAVGLNGAALAVFLQAIGSR